MLYDDQVNGFLLKFAMCDCDLLAAVQELFLGYSTDGNKALMEMWMLVTEPPGI